VRPNEVLDLSPIPQRGHAKDVSPVALFGQSQQFIDLLAPDLALAVGLAEHRDSRPAGDAGRIAFEGGLDSRS